MEVEQLCSIFSVTAFDKPSRFVLDKLVSEPTPSQKRVRIN